MRNGTFVAIAIVAISIMLFTVSCHKVEGVSAEEKAITLQSPSGQPIAGSMQDLRKKTAAIIARKFGGSQDFRITGVEHMPLKKGYVALVSYRLENGVTSNFAISSGVKVMTSDGVVARDEDEEEFSVTCVDAGSCTNCRIYVYIDFVTNTVHYWCSCPECKKEYSGNQ